MRSVLGVDCGTSLSVVAAWINGKVEIIANNQGNRLTPSFVSFGEEQLVGDAAKNQIGTNTTNTIFNAKRFIGRDFINDKQLLETEMKLLPFKVINRDDKPYFRVKHQGETKFYSPEEISGMVLAYMKKTACDYLGYEVKDAVITVPAYFNDAQRQATKTAGTIAGFNVIRIINEPTAAALAYGLNITSKKSIKVLIFDCGAGTHDVSILDINDGLIKVLATNGDTHLGGEDIDIEMTKYCMTDFKKRHNKDMSESPKAVRKLRNACERAKKSLSTSVTSLIEVDGLFEGIDYSINLSRAKFDEICMDIFKRTIEPVKKVLADAKMKPENVDEIILVGGSTRIPKVRSLLSEFFGGKSLKESVNPDEAVAYGACVQAAILSGLGEEKTNDIVLVDVTPLSLGVKAAGDMMSVIIERNKTIPVKVSKEFSTHSDNQTTVSIDIYEGERQLASGNNLLDSFTLDGIPPAPRGVPKIEVTFSIDSNGILNVTAKDKASSKVKNITITGNKGRFSEDQINAMIEEAKKYEEEDKLRRLTQLARNDLENLISSIKQSIQDPSISQHINTKSRKKIEDKCSEFILYLEDNPKASKEDCLDKKKLLESVWNPIAIKIYESRSKEQTSSKPDDEDETDEGQKAKKN